MTDNPTQYKMYIDIVTKLQEQGREVEMMRGNKDDEDNFFLADYTDVELAVRLKHIGQFNLYFG